MDFKDEIYRSKTPDLRIALDDLTGRLPLTWQFVRKKEEVAKVIIRDFLNRLPYIADAMKNMVTLRSQGPFLGREDEEASIDLVEYSMLPFPYHGNLTVDKGDGKNLELFKTFLPFLENIFKESFGEHLDETLLYSADDITNGNAPLGGTLVVKGSTGVLEVPVKARMTIGMVRSKIESGVRYEEQNFSYGHLSCCLPFGNPSRDEMIRHNLLVHEGLQFCYYFRSANQRGEFLIKYSLSHDPGKVELLFTTSKGLEAWKDPGHYAYLQKIFARRSFGVAKAETSSQRTTFVSFEDDQQRCHQEGLGPVELPPDWFKGVEGGR